MTKLSHRDFVARARKLAPRVRAASERIEREQRIPRELMAELAASGIFQMWVPRSAGGHEVDPTTNLRVIEELARADSAVGWVTMIITGTSHYASSRLETSVARDVYGRGRDQLSCGFVPPKGKAVAVEGGYRVSGHWFFGSGCPHARWLMAPCWVYDGDVPRTRPDRSPDWRTFVVPARQCRILDNWDALGMRGTESHDYTARNVFVPDERSFSLLEAPLEKGPLYAYTGLFLLNMAGVPLGTAQRALAAFVEEAQQAGNRGGLAEMAQAQAQIEAARALTYATADEIWNTLSAGKRLSVVERARYRLALTHAFAASAQAVETLYRASSIRSISTLNPIERCFRDIHTMVHHRSIRLSTYSWIGKMLLGRVPRKAVSIQLA